MPKTVRRSLSDTIAFVLKLTKAGPVTPQRLASELRVTGNRARQILEALRDEDRLEIVGKTQGGRGKPANIYGTPGMKLTASDVARLSRRTSAAASVSLKSKDVASVSEGSAIEALLKAIETRGLEVVGPGGIKFTVRFASEPTQSGKSPSLRRKYVRRKPKSSSAAPSRVKAKADAATTKETEKKPSVKKSVKPAKAAKKASTPKKPAPKRKSSSVVKGTQVTPSKPAARDSRTVKGSKGQKTSRTGEKSPKLELITPKAKTDLEKATAAEAAPGPEVTPPAAGGGG